MSQRKRFKNVQIQDEWEKFTLSLTVFHPFLDANEQMQVVGTNPALGNWNTTGKTNLEEAPITMSRADKNFNWDGNKYGCNVRPWNCKVLMDNKDWKTTVMTGKNKFKYKYTLLNDFATELENQEYHER